MSRNKSMIFAISSIVISTVASAQIELDGPWDTSEDEKKCDNGIAQSCIAVADYDYSRRGITFAKIAERYTRACKLGNSIGCLRVVFLHERLGSKSEEDHMGGRWDPNTNASSEAMGNAISLLYNNCFTQANDCMLLSSFLIE